MRGAAITQERKRREDARIDNWLWLYLDREGRNFPADSLARDDVRAYLAETVGVNIYGESIVDSLVKNDVGRYFLPLESLSWISEDERQISWLRSYLSSRLNVRVEPSPPSLFGKALIVALIDLYWVDIDTKARDISEMKVRWNEHLKSDSIFKWFKEEERSRCELARNWLIKNRESQAHRVPAISTYSELLMFFDGLTENIAEKKMDVIAIKRQWSQQKRRKERAEAGETQINFEISVKAISTLDGLAKKYGVSRAKIIEALIQFEAIKGLYLPEKIKMISWD